MTEGVVEAVTGSHSPCDTAVNYNQSQAQSQGQSERCASPSGRPLPCDSPQSLCRASPCAGRNGTMYSSVTTRVLAEFIPSRPTRQSTNKALQHGVPNVQTAMKQRGLKPSKRSKPPSQIANGEQSPAIDDALTGQYADLDFCLAQDGSGAGQGSSSSDKSRVRRDQLMSVYGLERSQVYENLVRPSDGAQASIWMGGDLSKLPGPGPLPRPDYQQSVSCPSSAHSSESLTDEQGTDNASTGGSVEDIGPMSHPVDGRRGVRTPVSPTASTRTQSDYENVARQYPAYNCNMFQNSSSPMKRSTGSLDYPRRLSSRRRTATPCASSQQPTRSLTRNRHYEETDLVTGMPFEVSRATGSSSSKSPGTSVQPSNTDQLMDITSFQNDSFIHLRFCSAPEVTSPLAEETASLMPASPSPLPCDSVFMSYDGRPTYLQGPPQPPQRNSPAKGQSQSYEVLSGTAPIVYETGVVDRTLLPRPSHRRNGSHVSVEAQAPSPYPNDVAMMSSHTDSTPSERMTPSPNGSSTSAATSACPSPELLAVGNLPCRKSWRESSALEVFGEFSVHYLGKVDITRGYGVVNSAMETVMKEHGTGQQLASPKACSVVITPSSIDISSEGQALTHYEVDSVETIAQYCIHRAHHADGTCPDCGAAFCLVSVEEGVPAACLVFQAKSPAECSTIVCTVESALYADVKQFKSMTYPKITRFKGEAIGRAGQFSVKHIGSIAVQHAYNSIDDAVRQVLSYTNPSQVQFSVMDLDTDRIRLRKTTSNVIYASHQTHAISSVGSFSEDCRVFGYVTRQRSSLAHMCHVFRCSRPATALAILECIRDICQDCYMARMKTKEDSDEDKGAGKALRSFFSRSRRSDRKSSEKSKQEAASIEGVAPVADMTRVRSESTETMVLVQLNESPPMRRQSRGAVDFAKQSPRRVPRSTSEPFQVVDMTESPVLRRVSSSTEDTLSNGETGIECSADYLGSGGIQYSQYQPKNMTEEILKEFASHGREAGAVECGSIKVSLKISTSSITLSDKNNVIFVRRNYPRRQLYHVDRHAVDKELFSFATLPPSMSSIRNSRIVGRSSVKVHLFRCDQANVSTVVSALVSLVQSFSV